MTGRKNVDLVERILTALDGSPEVEDYAIDEIEALPIEDVNARLQQLGVDPTVPPAITNFVRRANAPAQRVIDALYEHDSEEDEIERLDLNKVQAALHDAGLNYRAGVERIRQLTGASDHSEEPESPTPVGEAGSGGNVVSFSPPIVAPASYTDNEVSDNGRVFHKTAKPKRLLSWKVVVVAVAATACLFIVDKNASAPKPQDAALRSLMVAALSWGEHEQHNVHLAGVHIDPLQGTDLGCKANLQRAHNVAFANLANSDLQTLPGGTILLCHKIGCKLYGPDQLTDPAELAKALADSRAELAKALADATDKYNISQCSHRGFVLYITRSIRRPTTYIEC